MAWRDVEWSMSVTLRQQCSLRRKRMSAWLRQQCSLRRKRISVVIDEVHICTVTLTLVFERKNHIIVVFDVGTSCHSKWFNFPFFGYVSNKLRPNNFRPWLTVDNPCTAEIQYNL